MVNMSAQPPGLTQLAILCCHLGQTYTLPLYCCCLQALYSPNRPEILVGPGRQVNNRLFKELTKTGKQHDITFARVRDLYPKFDYSDLTQHRAIVLMPYQVCDRRCHC